MDIETNSDWKIVPCGSFVVCDPPVTDTDRDFLVYTPSDPSGTLKAMGYTEEIRDSQTGGSRPTWADGEVDHRFSSWRKGNINLIVTRSEKFAEKHELSTQVCKRLNLREKKDRIMIYQAILYGNSPQ